MLSILPAHKWPSVIGTDGPYLSLQTDVLCTGTLICRSLPDNGPFGLTLPQPVVTHTLGIGVSFADGGKHKHRTLVLLIFVGLESFINAAESEYFSTGKMSNCRFLIVHCALLTYVILVVVEHVMDDHLIDGYTLFGVLFDISVPVAEHSSPKSGQWQAKLFTENQNVPFKKKMKKKSPF